MRRPEMTRFGCPLQANGVRPFLRPTPPLADPGVHGWQGELAGAAEQHTGPGAPEHHAEAGARAKT